MGKILTKGIGSITVEPDAMTVWIVIKAKEENANCAIKKGQEKAERMLEGLRMAGADLSAIEADGYHVREERNYQDQNRYFEYSLHLELTTEADIKIANMIICMVRDLETDIEASFDFSVSNKEEIKEKLKIEALKDAKEKADRMAAAIGEKVAGMDKAGDLSDEYLRDEDYEEQDEPSYLSARRKTADTSLIDQLSIKKITITEDVKVAWLTEKAE